MCTVAEAHELKEKQVIHKLRTPFRSSFQAKGGGSNCYGTKLYSKNEKSVS